jgi:hypothetical protein
MKLGVRGSWAAALLWIAPVALAALLAQQTLPHAAPANAAIVIKDDPGGYLHEYDERYLKIAGTTAKIVIDGECSSACTTILGYVPLERICVTEKAWLGFHAPTEEDMDGNWVKTPEGTAEIMQHYPKPVRDWIVKKGGLEEEMIYLEGAELQKILKRCTT